MLGRINVDATGNSDIGFRAEFRAPRGGEIGFTR